jgi:hypothetical protein
VAPGVNGVIVQALVNSFKASSKVEARETGEKSDLQANSKRKSTHLRSDSGSEDESTDNSGKSGIYAMHFELCVEQVVRTREGKNIEERVCGMIPYRHVQPYEHVRYAINHVHPIHVDRTQLALLQYLV